MIPLGLSACFPASTTPTDILIYLYLHQYCPLLWSKLPGAGPLILLSPCISGTRAVPGTERVSEYELSD